MDGRVHILAHHGRSLFGRAIQWQTRSRWNHISVRVDDVVYEAMEGDGVRMQTVPQIKARVAAGEEVLPLILAEPLSVAAGVVLHEFLYRQVGKPYDRTMILRFLSRVNRESAASQERWFCSELAFAALQHAGVTLLRDTAAWEVSPGLLVRSPLLRPDPAWIL